MPSGVTESRYWSIPDHPEKPHLSRADAVDRLDHLLGRSVQSQLRSEVSVGWLWAQQFIDGRGRPDVGRPWDR